MTVEQVATFLNVSRAQAYLVVREDGFPLLIELGPRLLRVDPRRLQGWLDHSRISARSAYRRCA